MNRFHESLTNFGSLVIDEVFDYYDKPLLLSVKNELDHLYLVKLADETSTSEIWLYNPISRTRANQVRSGAIDLSDAFTASETGTVFLVKIPFDSDQSPTVSSIPAVDIDPDFLPPHGDRLEITTETLDRLQPVTIVARQLNRVIMRQRYHFENASRTEAPAAVVGNILIYSQNIINAIGQVQKENATKRGRIPKNITTQHEMLLRSVGAGSFEIELVSAHLPNLMGETEIDVAVEEFVNLIRVGSNPEWLKEKMLELQPRVAASYHSFLKEVQSHLKSADIEWSPPEETRYSRASITAETAAQAILIIELGQDFPSERIEVTGELVGINLRSGNFEIASVEGKYDGHIPIEMRDSLKGTPVGVVYRALLNKETRIKLTTGDTEVKYVLAGLSNI